MILCRIVKVTVLYKLRTWLWCLMQTHFFRQTLSHTYTLEEGARETEFRSSLKLSIDELHVLGAPPMQKTHLLGSLSLCSSNLCPRGVFWPLLVNPLRMELYWGAHNENKQKWYSDSPGDTKYILALTGQWTKSKNTGRLIVATARERIAFHPQTSEIFPTLER